jgi:hypothetical protein
MPEQTWSLSPEAHAVAVEDILVFLHVGADAYYCLRNAEGALQLASDRRSLACTDPAAIEPCRRAGLVAPGPPAHSRWAGLPPPTATAVRLQYPGPAWRDLAPLLASSLDLVRHYWRRPFCKILQRVADRPLAPASPAPELLALVDAFHRWVPYAPVSAKCLLRSFMLLRLLGRSGHGAHWVFGVRTAPFQAHCWLQCGGLVLDDDHERVAAFAPILVL